MQNISAATGWSWFKQGFSLFRRQPAELSTLFLSYLFLMLIVGLIPVAGQVLPLVLVPVFSIAFMEACIKVEKGERVYPNLLLTGFRSQALPRLLMLGAFYLVAVVAAVGASTLVDGGAFLNMLTAKGGTPNPAALAKTNWAQAMMTAGLVYLPAGMGFWFAAPLMAWQNMGLGKALFYSFFAVARTGKAFVLYLLAWMMIGVILPSILSTIAALLFRNMLVSLMVLLPLSLILTVVLYCSFYPTYVTVFGMRDTTPTPPAELP